MRYRQNSENSENNGFFYSKDMESIMDFGIQDLNKLRENHQIEAINTIKGFPSLWATYSAFANTFGGTIILGAKENDDHTLSLTHMEDPEKVLREFNNCLNNPKKVSANILTEANIKTKKFELSLYILPFRSYYVTGNLDPNRLILAEVRTA